jgi:hypothetical protein
MLVGNLSNQQSQLQDLAEIIRAFTAVSDSTVTALHNQEAVPSSGGETPSPPIMVFEEPHEVFPLTPSGRRLPVFACDMSTVHVADTVRGSIWAVRCSVVVKAYNGLSAATVGPLIYMVSPSTVEGLTGVLHSLLGCDGKIYPNMPTAPKIISNLFEKVIQLHLASRLEGGILLLDGSLISGPLDSPPEVVERIVNTAKESGQGVAAFSKTTTLTLYGRSVCSIVGRCRPPYVVRIPLEPSGPWGVREGSVYVAHLSGQLYPFRVDVAARTSDISLLNDLLSSDTMVYGYPETLIIAHQLAKLSRLDVLSIRTALGHTMGLKFVDAPDIRSSLFTPVSTG